MEEKLTGLEHFNEEEKISFIFALDKQIYCLQADLICERSKHDTMIENLKEALNNASDKKITDAFKKILLKFIK